ncbi:Protein IDA-LIKE 2 [Cocos nucifera]|nr:Protein IDA-LIKE 2 [Cocos nucifera]
MGRLRRGSTLLVWLLLLLLLASCCQGSRSMQVFKKRPMESRNSGYYFGFLPRGVPIPPSGPSKQHNSIGFESHGSP